MTNAIQSLVFDHKPCSSSFYNQLPHIDVASKEVVKHLNTRDHLLGMIAEAGLENVFSVHLIHKHFDVPDGQVMVYETVDGRDHPAFQLCSPRTPETCEALRGYFFRASLAGVKEAYEYTTDPGMDADSHDAFATQFANEVLLRGAQDIFALTLKQSSLTYQVHEFEMPDWTSMILVKDPIWLPNAGSPDNSTSTDWAVAASGDGIVSLSECTKTRSNSHHLIGSKCMKTRSDSHYKTGSMPSHYGDPELTLDGEILMKDSEAFVIISRAMERIEAY